MVTGNLIHAGRVLAGLSRDDLAALAGLSPDEVARLEEAGRGPLPRGDRAVAAVVAALRRSGVEVRPDDGPSLRVTSATVDEGMRPEELNAENDD